MCRTCANRLLASNLPPPQQKRLKSPMRPISNRNRIRDSLRPKPRVMPSQLRQPGCRNKLAIPRTATAEPFVAAVAAVVDAATVEAMAVIEDQIGAQTEVQSEARIEVLTALQSRASHALSSQRPPVLWNPAESSTRARPLDTSRSSCEESRFPNISATPNIRPRRHHQFDGRRPKSRPNLPRCPSRL